MVNLHETAVEDVNIENGPTIEGVDPTAAQGKPETNEQTENQSETPYLAVVEGAEDDDFETFQDTTSSVTTAETSSQIDTKTELSSAEKQKKLKI